MHTEHLPVRLCNWQSACYCFACQVGGKFTSTTGLSLRHWGWSILLSVFTTPIGMCSRLPIYGYYLLCTDVVKAMRSHGQVS